MEDSSSGGRNIKVFGSAILRVPPDLASIQVTVSRLEQQPKGAFAKAHEGAHSVSDHLRKAGVAEYGVSRVVLAQEHRYVNGENRFAGYRARVAFNVVVRSMEQVDSLLVGLIAAGADELNGVTFQTTRLKELRAEARRRAVAAAREKAELYCTAAGVVLGEVLAIEDVNPDTLLGRGETHGPHEPLEDDSEETVAMDPASITVAAAVYLRYALAGKA